MVASGVSLTCTWAYFLIAAPDAEPLRERRGPEGLLWVRSQVISSQQGYLLWLVHTNVVVFCIRFFNLTNFSN